MVKAAAKREIFEQAALPLYQDLYRAAWVMVRDEAQALDFAQEAYVRAYQSFDEATPPRNIRGWLFTILRNVVIDFTRQRKEESLPEEDVSAPRREEGELQHLEYVIPEEVLEALKELTPLQRWAVLLVDMYEFSYNETAEILECPVGTVMSALFHAREKLRQFLTSYAEKRRR